MVTLIYILIGIASVVVSFFSSFWCWLILVLPELYIIFEYWAVKQKRCYPLDGLSEEANYLFQEYNYYFLHRFAAVDFGAAAVIMAFTGIGVGIINIFYGFYFGIGLAIVNWFLMNYVSHKINPYNTLFDEYQKELSKEVFNYFRENAKEKFLGNKKKDD